MTAADPHSWLDAIRQAVKTLPHGTELLLAFAIVGVVRFALVPLIQAWRQPK